MPTTTETVRAINHAFRITNANLWTTRIRMAGLIQSTPGQPIPLPESEVALILISVLAGFSTARKPALATAYYNARPIDGGPSFGEALISFIREPHAVYSVTVANDRVLASITYRAADRSTQTLTFADGEIRAAPLNRASSISADTWVSLCAALNQPKPSRRHRRRNKS